MFLCCDFLFIYMEKMATHYSYETTIKIKKGHFLTKTEWGAFLDFFGVQKGVLSYLSPPRNY